MPLPLKCPPPHFPAWSQVWDHHSSDRHCAVEPCIPAAGPIQIWPACSMDKYTIQPPAAASRDLGGFLTQQPVIPKYLHIITKKIKISTWGLMCSLIARTQDFFSHPTDIQRSGLEDAHPAWEAPSQPLRKSALYLSLERCRPTVQNRCGRQSFEAGSASGWPGSPQCQLCTSLKVADALIHQSEWWPVNVRWQPMPCHLPSYLQLSRTSLSFLVCCWGG